MSVECSVSRRESRPFSDIHQCAHGEFVKLWDISVLAKRRVVRIRIAARSWIGYASGMTTLLQEVEGIIGRMSRPEKAQLLQWVVADLGDSFPGIDSLPGVCGGEPCIVRTRIPVWTLVQARRLGTTEAALLQAYPALQAEDLTEAWAYYRTHRDEIERQITENEQA